MKLISDFGFPLWSSGGREQMVITQMGSGISPINVQKGSCAADLTLQVEPYLRLAVFSNMG